jgi:hypothetical protein
MFLYSGVDTLGTGALTLTPEEEIPTTYNLRVMCADGVRESSR